MRHEDDVLEVGRVVAAFGPMRAVGARDHLAVDGGVVVAGIADEGARVPCAHQTRVVFENLQQPDRTHE